MATINSPGGPHVLPQIVRVTLLGSSSYRDLLSYKFSSCIAGNEYLWPKCYTPPTLLHYLHYWSLHPAHE